MGWRLALCLVAGVSAAGAAPTGPTATQVSWEVSRARDGHKYPNPVQERYQLSRDGKLHYSAYFGDMPMEMNHNDDVVWAAGESGQRVLAAVQQLLDQSVAGVRAIPDSESVPPGAYAITVQHHHADSTRIVRDRKSPAWAALDAAFAALIADFEKATHRPKKPNQLPQR